MEKNCPLLQEIISITIGTASFFMFYVTSGQPIHLTHLKKRNDSSIYTVELLFKSAHPQKNDR